MNDAPVLLDDALHPVAILENASFGWTLQHNDLCTAELRLPCEDAANDLCVKLPWVHLQDGVRDLGVYRITGMPASDVLPGGTRSYTLEHVLSLLLDDLIFGEMVFDGTSVRDAIQQLMERQTVKRWTMDACDFEQTVALSMSNISILEGIRKLCEELDAYTWECDTSALPFRLSVRKADAESKCGIHYGRNLTGIQMQMDATELVTRLYLIGGTGKDGKTVTVESLTADAVPYIDADTISQYGIRAAIYQNNALTTPEELLARGQQVLAERNQPQISLTATAIDLYTLTGYDWDCFTPGKQVIISDDAHSLRQTARIVTVEKQDARGDPGSIVVTIASKASDTLSKTDGIVSKLQAIEAESAANGAACHVAHDEIRKAETSIKQNADELQLKASKESVDALGQRMNTAESAIEVQASGIGLLSGRVTTVEDSVATAQAQILVNNDSIGTLVTRTDTLAGRTTKTESAIEQLSDSLVMYVKKDDDISAMVELRGDGVTISGGTITLTGYVTTGELDTIRAWATDFAGVTISGESVVAGYGDFDELVAGQGLITTLDAGTLTVGKTACVLHTLTIGTKTCSFFAPADATFDLSDMPGYDDALDAARREGASSVYVQALEAYGESYYSASKTITADLDITLSNKDTSQHLVSVDASSAYSAGYSAGSSDVTIGEITCVSLDTGRVRVVVKASNGKTKQQVFVIS